MLQRKEQQHEKRDTVNTMNNKLLKLADESDILSYRPKEKFLAKLFSIGSQTKNKLYGEYENLQRNKTILAIIYLEAPYNLYAIFAKQDDDVQRYKLHKHNEKSKSQGLDFMISEYVSMNITDEKFLQKMYDKYNTIASR